MMEGDITNHRKSAEPIRILFLTSVLDSLGGSEKNILDLVKNLSKDRFRTYVVALRGGVILDQVKRLEIPVQDMSLKSILGIEGFVKGLRLYRFVRSERIDILMTYHEDADVLGCVVGKLAGVRVLISNKRDMGYQVNWKHALAYRFLNKWVTRFIAVSKAVRQELTKVQAIPPSKIQVIYNGIDIKEPIFTNRSAYLRKLLQLPEDRLIVGMVASFRPVKGQELFVRAAAEVLKTYPEAEFVIIGNKNTDYYRQVSKLIDELGIASRIHCMGDRNDVRELLLSFDVFVLSSLHEGFSNAILEAMAAGLPIIAAGSGGNTEVVSSDIGILFQPGNSDDLGRAILQLLVSREMRTRMGIKARDQLMDKFSFSKMLLEYEELFLSSVRNSRQIRSQYASGASGV
jgi:glycosyltransferase involved in cell wall biosynthesis